MKKTSIALLILLTSATIVNAQDPDYLRDTLNEAVVTADAFKARPAGLTKVNMRETRQMVTALGESDVIKYIQTLPGISSGVEGTTSFYVRGGNLGNNVVTLDGVRLYGFGHLLGITTVFPNIIVKEVDFNVGGFDAESSNLLASHIKVQTKDGNFKKFQGETSISNFLVSAYATAPIIKDKLAFTLSARVSPVNFEYNILKGTLENHNAMFEDVEGNVYDIFAKVAYRPHKRHAVNASFFYSEDDFGYGNPDNESFDNLGWHNMLANLQWKYNAIDNRLNITTSASYNDFGSLQQQEKDMAGVYNRLEVNSTIEELSASIVADGKILKSGALTGKLGAKYNYSKFNPGSRKVHGDTSTTSNINKTTNHLITAFAQLKYERDKWHIMAVGRYNSFKGGAGGSNYTCTEPEISLSASLMLAKWLKLEVTYDRLAQFYHTLEGIPLGWSLDMIVPSNRLVRPETSSQVYGGFAVNIKDHTFSVGAYTKQLNNLIYFLKASEFFSSTSYAWSSFVEVGEGSSYGIETLYEKRGKKLNYKLAYTYSKTDRTFANVNEGRTFLAKYDRPHVLNVTGDYLIRDRDKNQMGVNVLFTYQSGNRESVKSGTYLGYLPGMDEPIAIDWYSGLVNNYRMPAYIRLDVGWWGKFYGKKVSHTVKAGIYNLLNRHNHFSLYYDNSELEWKKVYLFPLMPSLSYTIEF